MSEQPGGGLPEMYTDGVTHCARCGGDHNAITFKAFQKPVFDSDGSEWGWWGMCPTTGDPILLRTEVVQKEAFDDSLTP